MAKQEKTNEQLQVELLEQKLEVLSAKVTKPQTSEEAYQLRQKQYDDKAPDRAALQLRIDARRMELMMLPELAGKAKMSDIMQLEAWERRSLSVQKSDPGLSIRLMNAYKAKVREIQKS